MQNLLSTVINDRLKRSYIGGSVFLFISELTHEAAIMAHPYSPIIFLSFFMPLFFFYFLFLFSLFFMFLVVYIDWDDFSPSPVWILSLQDHENKNFSLKSLDGLTGSQQSWSKFIVRYISVSSEICLLFFIQIFLNLQDQIG